MIGSDLGQIQWALALPDDLEDKGQIPCVGNVASVLLIIRSQKPALIQSAA